jgi:hypothetical protein
VQLFADGSSVVDAYMTGGTLGPNTSQGELAPAVYLDATCTLEGRGVDFGPSDPDLVYDTRTFDVDTADVICELGWCITF